MSAKPLRLRPAARRDAAEITARYRGDAGPAVAEAFVAAYYADAIDASGLRDKPLRRFPHLIFYVERPDHIDILRVLHGKRDIPATLRGPG